MNQRAPLPFTLRQLQYIVAVAELGSFRGAAAACHVAQPSLSMQIAQVEEALGVVIFERDTRHVRVTRVGAMLVERAKMVILQAQQLTDEARLSADLFGGELRIGVIPTIAPYWLPTIAPLLAKKYPRLKLSWHENKTPTLVRQIKDGELDAAILAQEADLEDLESEHLFGDEFVLALPKTHRLTKNPAMKLRDLDEEEVLFLEDGHCFGDQAPSFCKRTRAQASNFRGTSLTTLVQMVATQGAVTLLPKLAVELENRRKQLVIREFAAPTPHRTIVLAFRPGSASRPLLEALAATLRG